MFRLLLRSLRMGNAVEPFSSRVSSFLVVVFSRSKGSHINLVTISLARVNAQGTSEKKKVVHERCLSYRTASLMEGHNGRTQPLAVSCIGLQLGWRVSSGKLCLVVINNGRLKQCYCEELDNIKCDAFAPY